MIRNASIRPVWGFLPAVAWMLGLVRMDPVECLSAGWPEADGRITVLHRNRLAQGFSSRGFLPNCCMVVHRKAPEGLESRASGFPVSEALTNEGYHRGWIVEPVGVVAYARLVDDLDTPTQGLVSRFDQACVLGHRHHIVGVADHMDESDLGLS